MNEDRTQSRSFLLATGVAVFVIFVTRALAFPHSWWMSVEPLLGQAIHTLDPLAGHPPAPGFPLYLDLAGMLMFKAKSPFVALVVAAYLSSIAATALLAVAFRRVSRDAVGGALAALLLFMTPAMLAFSSTPAPEASAVLFFAVALIAAGRLLRDDSPSWRYALILGAAVAGTVGCQPEWTLPVAVLLVVPLFGARGRRLVPIALIACAAVVAIVFAPLARALGGPVALARWIASASSGREILPGGAMLDAFGPPWLAVTIVLLALAGIVTAIRLRETMLLLVLVPAVVNVAVVTIHGSAREPVLAVLPAVVAISLLALRGLTHIGSRADP
ncbi:MAG: hypothetical protein ACSLFQ_12590 [Thermoanaerobaculia bacterium]